MSQFTKGEWHYDSVGNYVRLRENEAILAVVMHADTFEEKQANGRLMAAAPKMYMELKNFLDFVDNVKKKNPLLPFLRVSVEQLDMLIERMGVKELLAEIDSNYLESSNSQRRQEMTKNFTSADAKRISEWLTELKYKVGEDHFSEALRHCPCCGGKSKLITGHFLGYFVACINPKCGVHSAYFRTAWDAVIVWNMRTTFTEEAVFHESVTPDPEETFLLVPHCPLCGGEAYIRTPSFVEIGEIGKFSISCSNCKFTTREHDKLLYAVEEWNRRT